MLIQSFTFFKRPAAITACLSFAFLISGCGKEEGPTYAKVTGKVTLNGGTVPNGTVFFVPIDGTEGGASSGAIGKDGTYTLVGPKGKGVVVGTHKVFFQCVEDVSGPTAGSDPNKGMAKCRIPLKYQLDKTSDITKKVVEGDNTVNIDIVFKKKRR
jgi:hypothetical protein